MQERRTNKIRRKNDENINERKKENTAMSVRNEGNVIAK
jgi:hypothetical protein